MEVLLIRHGLTAGNLQKRYAGRTDEPLCSQGFADTRKAGRFPAVAKVVVSPMLRARQTASLLFPEAEQRVARDLREMDFGAFEGKTADEMASDAAYRAWVAGNCLDDCPGGEGVAGFSARVSSAFDQAVRQSLSSQEDPLIVVAHGGTLMAIMDKYATPRREYWQWHVPALSGWRARLDRGTWETCPRLTAYARLEVTGL